MAQYKPKPCVPCSKNQYKVEIPESKPFIQGAKMSFGRPRVQPDGGLIIAKKGWEPPPPIEGYDRDPNNPWRFTPAWAPCDMRQRIIVIKSCGATGIKMVCKCPQAPTFQADVKLSICKKCPFKTKKPDQE